MNTNARQQVLELGRRVDDQVARVLRPRGFSYHMARRMWVRSRSEAIHDGVGVLIDVPSSDGPLFVTANVSVYSPHVARQLGPEFGPAARIHLASLTRNIGQLLPEGAWRQWEIAAGASCDWMLGAFVTVLVDVGLVWQEQFDDLADYHAGLVDHGHRDHHDIAVPILQRLISDVPAKNNVRPNDPRRSARGSRRPAVTVHAGDPLWLCDD